MRIINLIDNLSPVNFGIWNAALATAPTLEEQYNCFPMYGIRPWKRTELPSVQKRAFSILSHQFEAGTIGREFLSYQHPYSESRLLAVPHPMGPCPAQNGLQMANGAARHAGTMEYAAKMV